MDQSVASALYWLDWLHLAKLTAGVALALGVTYEFAVDFISPRWEKVLEAARESEARAARVKIADANLRVSEAVLETMKLREKMADRRLSAEQQASIASKLRRFAGVRIGLIFQPETCEGAAFARDIIEPLISAGWRFERSAAIRARTLTRVVEIELDSTADDTTAAAGYALQLALLDEGISIDVVAPRGGNVDPPISAPLRINMGEKPPA